MPPTSRYGPHPNRPAANKQFTNRDGPINAFQAARQALAPDQHDVLAFHGVGGQGKTALGRKFRQILEEETPRAALWGHVDLADTHLPTPDRILLELRRSLRRSGKIEFPAFDVAFAHYWQQAYPHIKFQEIHRDLLTDKEGVFAHALESASSYAEALPAGIGLTMKALNWVRQRMRDFDNRYLPALEGLETFSPTEILDRLPYYLGLDLCGYQRRQRAKQLIVFLDTYDALWETFTQGDRWEVDAWARELVASAPGVLFVVFAREKLTWDTHEPDAWRGCLHHQPRLAPLTDEDADTFLRQIPIEEEAVRQTIIQAAEGHPFYLDLEVEHYLDLVADGATPQPEHFGETKQAILARFLRYRAREEQATLKVLSVVRSFDFELLEALVQAFQTGFPLTEFSHFVRCSFVEPESGGRYRLHSLMQAHLLESLEPTLQKQINDRAFTYYDERCQPESPKDLQPAHEIALVEAFYHRDMTDPQEAVAWINQRALIFYEAARYSLIEPLYQRALALCEQALGPDHPHTATSLNNLAELYRAQGRYAEAEPLYERALAIRKQALGPEHPTTANSLNHLAELYRARGRYAQAEPFHEWALAIREETLGPEHPSTAQSLHNLAELYRARGRYAQAEPLYQRALTIYEQALGPDDPHSARSLNNLAALYGNQGDYGRAEPLHQRALTIYEQALGPAHPDTAQSLNNLAELYRAQGRYAEAEPLYERALAIYEQTLGPAHPGTAQSLNNLAGLYHAWGEYAQAEPLYQRALAICEQALGPDHPHTATSLNNLAELYRAQGRYAEAEPLYERALAIYEQTLGPAHSDTAASLNNLAELYRAQGRYAEAEPLYERALAICEQALGPDHPHTHRVRQNYQALLAAMGQQK